jgi:hypothetical protein
MPIFDIDEAIHLSAGILPSIFLARACWERQNTVVQFATFPFSQVLITICKLKGALTVSHAIFPFSGIHVSASVLLTCQPNANQNCNQS